eukprot:7429959-Pyramimonas_sp.AAC.1
MLVLANGRSNRAGRAPHLLEHLLELVAVGGEEVRGPGEHGARGLVPRNEHAQQVVPQLLLRHL